MDSEQAINREAALWAVRTSDPDFDDWSGFTAWLEQSPAHNAAYDHMMLAVDEAAELARSMPAPQTRTAVAANDEQIAANDDDGVRRWPVSRRWFGGGIAASLAALFAFALVPTGPSLAQYETKPGETLAIELDGGAMIELGGGTRLELSGEDQRLARLIEGEAIFSVETGAAKGFEVIAGSDTIIDIGTIFDVRLNADQLQVEVAEGAVIVNPDTRKLRLDPGQSLVKRGETYAVSDVDIAAVGEWREGRVSFRSASLTEVADRLTRATGIAFSAQTRSNATLSGSILVEPIKADPASVGPLLDLKVEQTNAGWLISPS
ncbi:MAG: FecR domain-containing protein [Pseudomonadota bacterium]